MNIYYVQAYLTILDVPVLVLDLTTLDVVVVTTAYYYFFKASISISTFINYSYASLKS